MSPLPLPYESFCVLVIVNLYSIVSPDWSSKVCRGIVHILANLAIASCVLYPIYCNRCRSYSAHPIVRNSKLSFACLHTSQFQWFYRYTSVITIAICSVSSMRCSEIKENFRFTHADPTPIALLSVCFNLPQNQQ